MRVIRIIAIICVCGLAFVAGCSQQPTVTEEKGTVVWKTEFKPAPGAEAGGLPEGWKQQNKPGTPPAVFSLEEEGGEYFLHMEADSASGSLLTTVKGVDISKTPILRWRWRVDTFPDGGDGREKKKDDQAIGIYVGSGSMLSNKSVSYRWDTDTPAGAEGEAVYGGGIAKIKWYTVRNEKDPESGQWVVEERNVAKDFREAWGNDPGKIYLSITCNSQYTGTKAAADIAWIEFLTLPETGENKPSGGKE